MTSGIELTQYQIVSTTESGIKKSYKMEQGQKWRQFLVAVISNLSSVATGITLGWTSPIFAKLNDINQSPLSVIPTAEELSWIASLVPLGALIAPFIAGPLADIIGRKWTLLSSTAFFVLSYILLILTCNIPQILVARLIQGFGIGFVMSVQTMYVGEIASDDCRGALGSFMQEGIVLGILYVYIVGPYTSYVATQYINLIPSILFVATFIFMPETPHFLIAKGRKEDAIKSLKFLRGKSAEGVQEEYDAIQSSVEESMKAKGSARDVVSNKGNLRALISAAGLLAFQQLSGINVVLFYSQSIFDKAGSSLPPEISTIIVGVVMVIASGLTPFIADSLGRKIILLFSAGGMIVSHAFLGIYFYLDNAKSDIVPSISWLPIVSLVVFVLVYCVGFGPLPWAVAGEMFSPSIKSSASSICTCVCWILGFAVTKWFSSLEAIIGSYGAFWLFGVFCVVAFLFTLTYILETKGLSLQEIQDKLNGR